MVAGTQIGPNDALLVVDIQNDFCPGGALAVESGNAIVPLVNGLMPKFPRVVLTQDWHPAGHMSFASSHEGKRPFETITMAYGEQVLWPDHCVQGTSGATFHEDLNPNVAALIIRKGMDPEIDSYSAFYENDRKTSTGLAGYLKKSRRDARLSGRPRARFLCTLFGGRCGARELRGHRHRGCLSGDRYRRIARSHSKKLRGAGRENDPIP